MISQTSQNFLAAISSDCPINRMIKYRQYIKLDKNHAVQISNKMLQQALSNGFVTQYEEIYKSFNQKIPQKQGKYKEIRQKLVQQTNKLKTEAQQLQAVENTQQLVKVYFKIAQLYSQAADHHQASQYYKRIFNSVTQKQILKRQVYFEKWALQTYYNKKWSDLITFMSCDLESTSKKSFINYSIILDLKLIEMKKQKNFQNLIGLKFSLQGIFNNLVMSYQDLGFIYSLNSISFQSRENLRRDIRWSSKLQISFLKCQYKKFLKQLDARYQKAKYHPLIESLYSNFKQKIEDRIIRQVLSSYSDLSFKRIQQMTGFKQGKIKDFIVKNQKSNFLINAMASSVVQKQGDQKNKQFYQQVQKYYRFINDKYTLRFSTSFQRETKNISDLIGLSKKRGMGSKYDMDDQDDSD